MCNQGPKGAWNPKPWALKSREQASCSRVSGGPVITSPDKVPDCPPLCNQWDSILGTLQSQLSLPHAPVTLSHHQDIRSLITCSLLDSCPLCSLCFLFLDLTPYCPHPDPSRVPADAIRSMPKAQLAILNPRVSHPPLPLTEGCVFPEMLPGNHLGQKCSAPSPRHQLPIPTAFVKIGGEGKVHFFKTSYFHVWGDH